MIYLCCLFVFVTSTLASQQSFAFNHVPNNISTYIVSRPSSLLNYHETSAKPYDFGISIPTSVYVRPLPSSAIADHSTWQWKIKIHSPGALSLSLIFDKWQVPLGATVYIMDRNEKVQSLSRFSNASLTRLATQPMDGDTLYVVYKSYPHQLPPYLHIAHVVYGHLPIPFLNTLSLYESNQKVISTLRSNKAGTCNIDYACDAIGLHWSKQASSIAILLTHGNQRYCTGAFINNIEQDGRQLFLTAKHCITDTTASMTDMVLLNYQEKSCRSSSKFKRRSKTLRSLVLLNSSSISDYAIFELRERIPEECNVYLAGWTTEEKPDWPLIGIHHPQGDVKKLSIYNNSLKPSCWDECPKKSHWKVERWTRGTTESGSSGSPLFDPHHRIVGQLHGGQAACWNKNGYDMYGSFKESWHLGLSNILDPYDRTSKQYQVKLDGVYLNTIRDSNYPEDKL